MIFSRPSGRRPKAKRQAASFIRPTSPALRIGAALSPFYECSGRPIANEWVIEGDIWRSSETIDPKAGSNGPITQNDPRTQALELSAAPGDSKEKDDSDKR